MLSYLAVVSAAGFELGRLLGMGYTFLWIALVIAVAMNLFAYYGSDMVALSASGAREIGRADNADLYRLVENLTLAGGLPMPRLYLIDSTAANAFAAGRDPDHASIAVTKGLLQKLDKEELEGVIAHELAHIKRHDTRLATAALVLLGLVALMTDVFVRWTIGDVPSASGSDAGTTDEDNWGRSDGSPVLWLMLVLAMIAALPAKLTMLAILRKKEFVADAEAALLTRYPEGLARALDKMAYELEPLKTAGQATAPLYIVDPLKGRWEVGLFAGLFTTHPRVEERIAALRGMEK
jgi:heat shock protein HtpX